MPWMVIRIVMMAMIMIRTLVDMYMMIYIDIIWLVRTCRRIIYIYDENYPHDYHP